MTTVPIPSEKLTHGERRYLLRSFVVLWIFLGLMSLVVARIFLPGLGKGMLTRTMDRPFSYSSSTLDWPKDAPPELRWPTRQDIAYFQGMGGFVSGIYVNGWDGVRTRFHMEVYQAGMPFVVIDRKTSRIFPHRGPAVYADPAFGAVPRVRFSLLGAIGNATIYTLIVWVFVGLFPVALNQRRRVLAYRRWAKQAMCTACGYDILELAVCPECGIPSHKARELVSDDSE